MPGLPARVGHSDWKEWLQRFPPVPAATLGAAMVYRRNIEDHLAKMPPFDLLTRDEQRRVGDDLAHYCRILQGAQETSIKEALMSLGGSTAALIGKMYFPGAELLLLAAAVGLAGLGLLRVYDMKRRERIIRRLVDQIDKLSWQMKS